MKQTAVEWLIEHLMLNEQAPNFNELMINKAKEMEKEQIIKTFIDVNIVTQKIIGEKLTLKDYIDYMKIAEQYYNETFKSE